MSWVRAGAMVFTGGIFYDHNPGFGRRLLRRILSMAAVSRALGKKVALLGVSIGPLTTARGHLLTRKILKLATAIWVRDRLSYQYCRKAGVHCFLMPDLSALFYSSVAAIAPSGRKRELLFIPCRSGLTLDMHVNILEALKPVARVHDLDILLLPIHRNTDMQLAHRLSEQHGVKLVSDCFRDPEDLFVRIKQAEFVVSARLHGGWAAYLACRPFLQVDYHPKCRGFAETINLPMDCLIDPYDDPVDVSRAAGRWLDNASRYYDQMVPHEVLEQKAQKALARAARQLMA